MKGSCIGYDKYRSAFIFQLNSIKEALRLYNELVDKHFHPELKGKIIYINWRIDYHGWLNSKFGENKLIPGYEEYEEEQRQRQVARDAWNKWPRI